jgi:hypothetical protein
MSTIQATAAFLGGDWLAGQAFSRALSVATHVSPPADPPGALVGPLRY